jgi:hypothetical protein
VSLEDDREIECTTDSEHADKNALYDSHQPDSQTEPQVRSPCFLNSIYNPELTQETE